jgi:thymidylate synthase ThyX
MPPAFIYPRVGAHCEFCLSGDESRPVGNPKEPWVHSNGQMCFYDQAWLESIQMSENNYKELLTQGWRPQEARSVFPNALAAKILVTMNLRSWRHFFLMRTTKEAHPQIREVSIPLLREFQSLIPVLYNDIEPEMSQMNNITKGR